MPLPPDLPTDYHETTVNIVHSPDKKAYIWTQHRRVISRLKSLGFAPVKVQNRGVWFETPERCVWFKNPRRISQSSQAISARRAILVKARAAQRAASK